MKLRFVPCSFGIMMVLLYSGTNAAPVISDPLKLESSRDFTCGPDKAHIEIFGGGPIDMLDAKRVVVKFLAYTGEESKLTFITGSFGIHCPKHPLGWKGFFVFQTACPAKDFAPDQAPPCDEKNNYGVVFHAEVLMVPHWRNGKLAAELFNVSSKVKTPLEPVPTLFNVNLSAQSNPALKRAP